MSWHAHAASRTRGSGKFHSQAQMGTVKSTGQEYRGWNFSLIAHQTSTGLQRTRYAVSIGDPKMRQVKYLRDFSNAQQATDAARECIDRILASVLPKQIPGVVGTIPRLPTRRTAQEK